MAKKSWTENDINNMSMEEYAKHREWIMNQVRNMTPEEAREALEIPQPPPPFHFQGF